jgi:hypothetical protein
VTVNLNEILVSNAQCAKTNAEQRPGAHDIADRIPHNIVPIHLLLSGLPHSPSFIRRAGIIYMEDVRCRAHSSCVPDADAVVVLRWGSTRVPECILQDCPIDSGEHEANVVCVARLRDAGRACTCPCYGHGRKYYAVIFLR